MTTTIELTAIDDSVAPEPQTVSTEQWLGFFAMVFGIFMAILDIQIVASSLAQIQAGLSATLDEITWVQTAYLVAEVVIIPLSGWLARAFSTRILFVLSCGGFTLMSLCCVFAWNLQSMVVFRAFQGLFGGAMIPTVFAVIYTLFPRRLQPAMVIVVGMVVMIAPTAGPVLGGYLTEVLSWKALFLINLVPGVLVCLATWRFVRVDEPEWELLQKIDFLGIVYIVALSRQHAIRVGRGRARTMVRKPGDRVFQSDCSAIRRRAIPSRTDHRTSHHRSLGIPQSQFRGRLYIQFHTRHRYVHADVFDAGLSGQR